MLGYLKTGLVMVVVEELVNDEESCPVGAERNVKERLATMETCECR